MPLYEYHCEECGETFSLLRRFSEREKAATCPRCGSTRTRPVFSTFAAGKAGARTTSGGGCSSNSPFR